ncbi:MAG TPA: sigma-70 family RNA polymerase sigma factor [Actinomycetota bacterium]|jgi:RNA polymerase sigma factor (sigma-70 family)
MNHQAVTGAQHTVDLDFESFFREEHPRVFRLAYLLTGDRAEAADIAQEAMARVLERWDQVRTMGSPGGYLVRVAVHLHHRRLRRLRLRPREEIAGRAAVADGDPAAVAATRTDVMRVLLSLPAGQRQALVLTEWLGLDSAEAGRTLGIRPSSVRARVHRARSVFRDELGADYA